MSGHAAAVIASGWHGRQCLLVWHWYTCQPEACHVHINKAPCPAAAAGYKSDAEETVAKVLYHADFTDPRCCSALLAGINNMVTCCRNELLEYAVRIVFVAHGIIVGSRTAAGQLKIVAVGRGGSHRAGSRPSGIRSSPPLNSPSGTWGATCAGLSRTPDYTDRRAGPCYC